MVGKILVFDTLHTASLVEPEVNDSAADPRDETRGVGQVDEPVEDDTAVVCNVQVGECAEETAGTNSSIRSINKVSNAFERTLTFAYTPLLVQALNQLGAFPLRAKE